LRDVSSPDEDRNYRDLLSTALEEVAEGFRQSPIPRGGRGCVVRLRCRLGTRRHYYNLVDKYLQEMDSTVMNPEMALPRIKSPAVRRIVLTRLTLWVLADRERRRSTLPVSPTQKVTDSSRKAHVRNTFKGLKWTTLKITAARDRHLQCAYYLRQEHKRDLNFVDLLQQRDEFSSPACAVAKLFQLAASTSSFFRTEPDRATLFYSRVKTLRSNAESSTSLLFL